MYLLKTQEVKIDNDNIKKVVSHGTTCGQWAWVWVGTVHVDLGVLQRRRTCGWSGVLRL